MLHQKPLDDLHNTILSPTHYSNGSLSKAQWIMMIESWVILKISCLDTIVRVNDIITISLELYCNSDVVNLEYYYKQ